MGFEVAQQQPMPVVYRGVRLSCGDRTDLSVERDVSVEVKAVSRIEPIHEAQVIAYLRLLASVALQRIFCGDIGRADIGVFLW